MTAISAYALLFETLKRQGIFEGYRQGIKELGEPPLNISPATIDRAKAKVLDVTLAALSQKSPKLYQMLQNAASEVLINRMYQDLKNDADYVTDTITPDQLFTQLWKKQGQ